MPSAEGPRQGLQILLHAAQRHRIRPAVTSRQPQAISEGPTPTVRPVLGRAAPGPPSRRTSGNLGRNSHGASVFRQLKVRDFLLK